MKFGRIMTLDWGFDIWYYRVGDGLWGACQSIMSENRNRVFLCWDQVFGSSSCYGASELLLFHVNRLHLFRAPLDQPRAVYFTPHSRKINELRDDVSSLYFYLGSLFLLCISSLVYNSSFIPFLSSWYGTIKWCKVLDWLKNWSSFTM